LEMGSALTRAMFLLCCGKRERKPRGDEESVEPDENTWLISPDQPTIYSADVNPTARIEADALRNIVRETENKMVNITDPQPFLFQHDSSPANVHDDISPYHNPSAPVVPLEDTDSTPRGPSAPPPSRAPTPMRRRASRYGYEYDDRSYSSSSSRSMSPSSSMTYSDYDEHSAPPRGPILKVKLVPVPRKVIRAMIKAEEQAKNTEKNKEAKTGGGSTKPFTPVVHALSKDDHDSITTLSETLCTALEQNFRISQSQKVVRTWD